MKMPHVILLWLILAVFLHCSAAAQTELVLHRFTNKADGGVLTSSLVSDKEGHFYGTTTSGGDLQCTSALNGCGTVFELSRGEDGKWHLRTLYEFHGGQDGAEPSGGLVLDSMGNLYGTTAYGGDPGENGTVFELQRSGSNWNETVLFRFNRKNGSTPTASLRWGPDGALYGTTAYGGLYACKLYFLDTPGCGVVFRLEKTPTGWSEEVLHTFHVLEGAQLYGGLTFDKAGNIYGAAYEGGTGGGIGGGGTIFEINRANKRWTETTLYNFAGNLGNPVGELVVDEFGNIYGATEFGGDYGYGSVFELSPSGNTWSLTTLHSFDWFDGLAPHAGVVMDSAGNIYGTAIGSLSGSCLHGCGLVYMLDKSSGWAETVLHAFKGGRDGSYPGADILLDEHGNLYGTTAYGGDVSCTAQGNVGCGTVFKLHP